MIKQSVKCVLVNIKLIRCINFLVWVIVILFIYMQFKVREEKVFIFNKLEEYYIEVCIGEKF